MGKVINVNHINKPECRIDGINELWREGAPLLLEALSGLEE
jgi:hypothetical protein